MKNFHETLSRELSISIVDIRHGNLLLSSCTHIWAIYLLGWGREVSSKQQGGPIPSYKCTYILDAAKLSPNAWIFHFELQYLTQRVRLTLGNFVHVIMYLIPMYLRSTFLPTNFVLCRVVVFTRGVFYDVKF